MIYQFNEKTGELTVADKVLKGFSQISEYEYNSRLDAIEKERTRTKTKKAETRTASIDTNTGTFTTFGGKFVGEDGSGKVTITVDGKDGSIKAQSGDFLTKPTTVSAKGVKSPIATMQDISDSNTGISGASSPKGTIDINMSNKTNVKFDVVPATKTQLGGVIVGENMEVTVAGVIDYKLPMADPTKLGGVKVIGGNSGIVINEKGEVSVDKAISPLDYLGTLDASKNEGGTDKHKLTDEDDPAVYHGGFYVVSVPGTITFTHGDEVFEEGDWAIFEFFEGDTKGKWVSVPVGKYQIVHSVNGKIGNVILNNADIGLGNVKNVDQTNASNITSGVITVEVNTTKNITTTGTVNANGAEFTDGVINFYKSV